MSVAQDKTTASEKAKWEALIPTIEKVLTRQGSTCPGQRIQVGIKDADDIAGNSVALVNFCPGGAYTDWIVAMKIEKGQPVLARFRKDDGKPADVGFAEGASVMHGMDVKLVPGKDAIYDIGWDNDENLRLKSWAVTALCVECKRAIIRLESECLEASVGDLLPEVAERITQAALSRPGTTRRDSEHLCR